MSTKKLNRIQIGKIKEILPQMPENLDMVKNLHDLWEGESPKGMNKYTVAANIIKMTPIIGQEAVKVLLQHNGVTVEGQTELLEIINNEDKLSTDDRKKLQERLDKNESVRRYLIESDILSSNMDLFKGTAVEKYALILPETQSVIDELPSPTSDSGEGMGSVNNDEKESSIEEMSTLGKIATEIVKGAAAGATPGVLTANPEGAIVGAGIGAVGGAVVGIGNVISDAITGKGGNVEVPAVPVEEPITYTLVEVMEQHPVVAQAEDNLDNVLDNMNVALPNLEPIDMVVDGNLITALEEETVKPDEKMDVTTISTRPGYYKKAIHADALGLFFGSSVNPNWNNGLFFDRSQVLTEGDISNNKSYYYQQSLSLVNKYGVDFLVPGLKYNAGAEWKDIIKENHEILQLYFKLKGIEPIPTKPVKEVIKSLVQVNVDSEQKSVDIEDYQSGHDTKIENDKYNPFREVSSDLLLNPKDAYDMRLLGNGVPIEGRKTFRSDPQVLNNIVVKDLKKSAMKGKLPVTTSKNTVVPILNNSMRFASEEELCSSLFKFNY